MKNKAIIYKALKTLFFLLGFPLLLMLMIITMAPMFDAEVTGDFAQNWIIVYTVIGVVLLAVHIILEKFVGSKGKTQHKLVLIGMAVLSVLCILLPTCCYDAVHRPKYEEARKQLVGEVNVKDYDAVQGWHRDFTTRYKSDVYALINDNYDFMKLYGLEHTYSEWYNNATDEDRENGVGKKYGSFEKAEKLTKDKLAAKANLERAQAELAEIESAIQAKLTASEQADEALAADPENETLKAAAATAKQEYETILQEKDEDLVRLKGQRVDITAYKGELVDILLTAIKDPNLLPDGLNINLVGIDLNVGNLLGLVMNYAGDFINADTLNSLIPDVIYTGIGPKTVSTYQKAVDGSDGDVSLAKAQELNFKYKYYPAALASGAVRYVSFICVGIVVFCIFATDYFHSKEKEEESRQKEEGNQND